MTLCPILDVMNWTLNRSAFVPCQTQGRNDEKQSVVLYFRLKFKN